MDRQAWLSAGLVFVLMSMLTQARRGETHP